MRALRPTALRLATVTCGVGTAPRKPVGREGESPSRDAGREPRTRCHRCLKLRFWGRMHQWVSSTRCGGMWRRQVPRDSGRPSEKAGRGGRAAVRRSPVRVREHDAEVRGRRGSAVLPRARGGLRGAGVCPRVPSPTPRTRACRGSGPASARSHPGLRVFRGPLPLTAEPRAPVCSGAMDVAGGAVPVRPAPPLCWPVGRGARRPPSACRSAFRASACSQPPSQEWGCSTWPPARGLYCEEDRPGPR